MVAYALRTAPIQRPTHQVSVPPSSTPMAPAQLPKVKCATRPAGPVANLYATLNAPTGSSSSLDYKVSTPCSCSPRTVMIPESNLVSDLKMTTSQPLMFMQPSPRVSSVPDHASGEDLVANVAAIKAQVPRSPRPATMTSSSEPTGSVKYPTMRNMDALVPRKHPVADPTLSLAVPSLRSERGGSTRASTPHDAPTVAAGCLDVAPAGVSRVDTGGEHSAAARSRCDNAAIMGYPLPKSPRQALSTPTTRYLICRHACYVAAR